MKSVRRIIVEIPAGVDDTGLFDAVTLAALAWMPAERDGWDVEVSGDVVRRLDEDELDEESKRAEEWLDNLDLNEVEWKDTSDIRRITYVAEAYTSAERRLVAAIRHARAIEKPEWLIHLAANAQLSPAEPDDDVIIQSPEEYQRARERALESIGMTYEELAEQARTGMFSSPRARKVWVVIGDHWRGDESDDEERRIDWDAYHATLDYYSDVVANLEDREPDTPEARQQLLREVQETFPLRARANRLMLNEPEEGSDPEYRAERRGDESDDEERAYHKAMRKRRDRQVRRWAAEDIRDSARHYTYQVRWSDEDEMWVATVEELSSLSWLDPDKSAALERVYQLVADATQELTREEAWAALDRAARRYLDMSAEQFEREYDLGRLPDSAKVSFVSDRLSMARQ